MSFAATSKSAACGKRALILSAAVLAGLAVLFGGAGGAGAAATALCTTTTSAPTATPNSTLRGTPITYTATVTASAGCANGFPTGSVGFYSNYVIDGQPTSFQVGSSVTLVPTATPGVSLATLVDNSLPAGSFAITSSYTSDNEALFYDSSSATGTSVTVSNPTIDKTKIDFTLTPSTTTVGQSVSFSVQLTSVDASGNPTGVVPTGTVDFSAGPTAGFQNLFASFQLDSTGSIAFTYNGFVPGDYVVIASYPGDGANAGIEGELQLHVLAGPSAIPTTTTIAANPDTFQSGQTTTLSAHVAESGGGTPPAGGEVDFFAGTSPTDLSSEGSALIDASGNASVNVGNFPAGTYVVRAQYLGNAASDIQGSFGDSTMFVSTSSNGGGQDPTSTSYTGSVQAASLTEVTLTGHLDKGDGTPLTGEPLTLTLGSQKCTTAATLGSGDASCAITISQPAGQYPVTASFAGDSNWQASSGTSTFTVLQAGTSVAYTGATTGTFGSSAALAATLTDSNGSPVSGETVHLTMDGKSCDGITNGSGVASCSVAITENPAAYPITVTFGGDSSYSGSSTTSSFTVTPATTATTYTGATQSVQGGTVTLSAHVDGAPDGGMVTFTVGAESCTGTVSSGNASCQVTIADAPGSNYTVTATYAGDAAHLGSTDSKPFTVVAPITTTHISSIAPVLAGSAVTLGATVSPSSAPGTVTFSTGGTTLCTAPLAGGAASCSATFAQTGTYTVTAKYGGNGVYPASSDSTSALVYALAPGGGSFVVGDKSATGSVTFWGAQWSKVNALTGGAAPNAFKGFALNAATCGGTWTTDPGNSSPPPAGPLPAYMAVLVTSKGTKSGSQISGNVVALVIVQTNSGYKSDPGHAGTGTVVATIPCGS